LEQEEWVDVFTTYLKSQGYRLRLYDIDHSKVKVIAEKNDCPWLSSLPDVISDVDMVFLCTSIKETPKIIQRITLQ